MDEFEEARLRNGLRLGMVQHDTKLAKHKAGRPRSVSCKICGRHVSGRHVHTDHCHKTGKHRGYLCHNCNIGLGNFKDNINVLRKAIDYLFIHA